MKRIIFYFRSSHWLVVPKPGWPQASRTGLSMKFLESDKFGNQHFTFDHSASYQTIQKRFFHAVDSFNPEFIIVSPWLFHSTYLGTYTLLFCKKNLAFIYLNPSSFSTKIRTLYAFLTGIPTGEQPSSATSTIQNFWSFEWHGDLTIFFSCFTGENNTCDPKA